MTAEEFSAAIDALVQEGLAGGLDTDEMLTELAAAMERMREDL